MIFNPPPPTGNIGGFVEEHESEGHIVESTENKFFVGGVRWDILKRKRYAETIWNVKVYAETIWNVSIEK